MSCAIMTKNNTTTSMFKHNLRNSFCYYSGNIVIFQILLQYRCARESRCEPFANLKVTPPCRSRLQRYKIYSTFP